MTHDRNAHPSQPARNAATLDADIQRHSLSALCDATARKSIVALAIVGLAVFTPLAMQTRNGWQFAALLVFVLGSVFRWVTSWNLDQQLQQANAPTLWPLVLVSNGLTGLGWALAAATTMIQAPTDHGGAIVMAATIAVIAASLWLFAPHRDACRAFVAPMALLPVAVLFAPGALGLGLAALAAVAVAGAAALAVQAERAFVERTVTNLRHRTQLTGSHKLQREYAGSLAKVAASEEDRGLLFEHARVGLAAVVDRRIERVNAHLAHQLKQTPEALVGKDVLHLIARESQDAVDALAKSGDPARGMIQVRLNLGSQIEGGKVEVITPTPGPGSRLWVFKDAVNQAIVATREAKAGPPPVSVFNQHLLADVLAGYAARAQDLTIMVVALQGWHDLTDQIGIARASCLLDATARRLQDTCRADDRVARLEGASFVVLVAAELNEAQVQELRVRIATALEAPHTITDPDTQEDRRVHLGASIEPVLCQVGMQQPATVAAMVQEALVEARRTKPSADAETHTPQAQPRSESAIKPLVVTPRAPAVAPTLAIELISLIETKTEEDEPAATALSSASQLSQPVA